jgi:hypothetical protein
MSAQRPDQPGLRPSNPFERRVAVAVAQAKPSLRNGSTITRTMPGGTTVESVRRSGRSTSAEVPFSIRSDYSIVPGLVGTLMPTLEGVRLDSVSAPKLSGIPTSGTRYVFFKLTFSTTFNSGYLSSFTLATVEVILSTSSSQSDTSSVKHLLFSTINNGVPSASYANKSPIPVTLWDNGYDATTLRIGNL